MRIVSLLPGATETLFALGPGGCVVAVTHECDHPAAARALRGGRKKAAQLSAAGAARVAVFDGCTYFNRPGPRLVESLEVLVREAASIMPCG